MAFRFTKSNCVVVGTFNMYIIQPAWLTARRIIQKSIEIKIEANLEEPGLRFSSPSLASQWLVTPTRLVVESEDRDEDCGESIAKVIKELPWTPLIAIGANSFYKAKRAELPTSLRFLRGEKLPKMPRGSRIEQSTYLLAVRKGDQIINLQVSILGDMIELKTNVHTDLRGKDSSFACQAAQGFLGQRKYSEKLLAKLFGIRVRQGDSHA